MDAACSICAERGPRLADLEQREGEREPGLGLPPREPGPASDGGTAASLLDGVLRPVEHPQGSGGGPVGDGARLRTDTRLRQQGRRGGDDLLRVVLQAVLQGHGPVERRQQPAHAPSRSGGPSLGW